MKFRYLTMLLLAFISVKAAAQITTYDLKKGQAFDILLFNTNPDAKETLDRYFKSAIPIAQQYGYQPQKGFKVSQKPLQGNYWPKTVIIGLWSDYEKREDFVTEITEHVPDFHEMRREIWTSFYLTFWEVKEDKTVTVDRSKFNVMTAYWMENQVQDSFSSQWLKQAEKAGGSTRLMLTNGTSPYGYYYNPDFLTITSWESKEAFEAFQADAKKIRAEGLTHINQFIIE